MHEYSLMERVIEEVHDGIQRQGITGDILIDEVTLRVGSLEMHSEESFRQAFRMITRGTILDGAKLNLEIVPARIECPACKHSGPVGVGEADCHDPSPIVECPKCGALCAVEGGRGVDPIDLDIRQSRQP